MISMTQEGYDRLVAELDELRTTKRQDIAAAIKEAREFGEIAENAEYSAAKDEQALLEDRIFKLEERLRSAEVVKGVETEDHRASFGMTVYVKDQKTGESTKYKLVGPGEGNPADGRLSIESPVGSALLGKHRGDVVDIRLPKGKRQLKVTKIGAE